MLSFHVIFIVTLIALADADDLPAASLFVFAELCNVLDLASLIIEGRLPLPRYLRRVVCLTPDALVNLVSLRWTAHGVDRLVDLTANAQ